MPDAEEPTFTAQELDESLQRSLYSDRARGALGSALEAALGAALTDEMLKELIVSSLRSETRDVTLAPETRRVMRQSARDALGPERISELRQVVSE